MSELYTVEGEEDLTPLIPCGWDFRSARSLRPLQAVLAAPHLLMRHNSLDYDEEKKEQKQVEQSFVDTLLAEELSSLGQDSRYLEMIDSIPADCSYRAGAVGFRRIRNTIRVILTNN